MTALDRSAEGTNLSRAMLEGSLGGEAARSPVRSSRFDSEALNDVVRQNFDFWLESGSYLLFRNKKLNNSVVPPPA